MNVHAGEFGESREQKIFTAYQQLSANLQNFDAAKVEADGGNLDLDTHIKHLILIERALEKLVALEYIERKEYLLDHSLLQDEGLGDLFNEMLNSLSEKHGVLVAEEMLGQKAKLNFVTIQPGEIFSLVLHLPHEEMTKVSKAIDKMLLK